AAVPGQGTVWAKGTKGDKRGRPLRVAQAGNTQGLRLAGRVGHALARGQPDPSFASAPSPSPPADRPSAGHGSRGEPKASRERQRREGARGQGAWSSGR